MSKNVNKEWCEPPDCENVPALLHANAATIHTQLPSGGHFTVDVTSLVRYERSLNKICEHVVDMCLQEHARDEHAAARRIADTVVHMVDATGDSAALMLKVMLLSRFFSEYVECEAGRDAVMRCSENTSRNAEEHPSEQARNGDMSASPDGEQLEQVAPARSLD